MKNTMKERPILFSTPMVQAILNGTKTQTRRARNLKEINIDPTGRYVDKILGSWRDKATHVFRFIIQHSNPINIVCPFGEPGDVLWVRETWADISEEETPNYIYRADNENWQFNSGANWKPSIFMPREACRIKLLIKDVRVERLWDISSVDALDEGISVLDEKFIKKHFRSYYDDLRHWKNNKKEGFTKPPLGPSPRAKFLALWESINGIESRDQNPYTWVLTFERI